jgi:hypothetical protein
MGLQRKIAMIPGHFGLQIIQGFHIISAIGWFFPKVRRVARNRNSR